MGESDILMRKKESNKLASKKYNQNKKNKKELKEDLVKLDGKYECEQCHKLYSSPGALYLHKQSAHEGVKYSCDQCEYHASTKSGLWLHIRSKHEGIKYACHQCNFQATTQGNLKRHIESKHEG